MNTYTNLPIPALKSGTGRMVRIIPLKNKEKSHYSKYIKVHFKSNVVFIWWLCSEEKNFSPLQSNQTCWINFYLGNNKRDSCLFRYLHKWPLQTQGPCRRGDAKPWKSQSRAVFHGTLLSRILSQNFSQAETPCFRAWRKGVLGKKK